MSAKTSNEGRPRAAYDTPDPEQVREMFTELSPTYDRGNRIISLGLDRFWRRRQVRACRLEPGGSAIDFCCGTGDVTFELERAVGSRGYVRGVDFSEGMLKIAGERAARSGSRVEFVRGDVFSLDIEENTFDASTIAFGIRNLADTEAGIREMARVVRSGGIVSILETGMPPNPLVAWAYGIYNRKVIPTVGGWISGSRSAYLYLHDTSNRFPYGTEFKEIMERTGCFSEVSCTVLTFGVAYIYAGTVA